MKNIYLCLILLGITLVRPALAATRSDAYGETHKLNGVVRDESTREPLIFANIIIEETHQGITTDAKGKFTFVVTQDTITLRCSYVGYKTEIIPIVGTMDTSLTIGLVAMDVLLQDVTVYAHRLYEADQTEVSILSLQSEKIKNITSAIPDVMRSIQMLPGVSANNEFSAKFNVRGGNQDENLVLVNGTQVYDPFHVKEAPNASIGIFNVDMIKKMDLVTGGFTARYGDKMSSVLNIEYREGSREQYKGIASLSMTDAGAIVEGPLGENGSFIIGGRKSYLENVLGMLNVASNIHISFYDIQGVLGYSISPRQKLLLKFIHADDDFTMDPRRDHEGPSTYTTYPYGYAVPNTVRSSEFEDNSAVYTSSMAALQSVNILSSSALMKSEISLYDQREAEKFLWTGYYEWQGIYRQDTCFYKSNMDRSYGNELRIRTLELNSTLDLQLTSPYGIKTGLCYQRINYSQNLIYLSVIEESKNYDHFPDTTFTRRVENTTDIASDRLNTQSYKIAGFLENIIQLSGQVLLNVGGRFDYFDLNKDLTWSPRINIAYRTESGVIVRGAWGYYYQSPSHRQIAYSTASDTNTLSQRAIHYVLGTDYDVMVDQETQHFIKFKLEGYHKKYDNLVTAMQSGNGLLYSRKNDATGTAWGIDAYIAYSSPGFYGWISYGYLKANQTLIKDTIGHSYPRNTDQRHTLAAIGEVDLGSEWKLNTRFTYGSGYPTTPAYTVFDQQGNYWKWVVGSPNSTYLPAYIRLDVRITKDFTIFGMLASIFLDVNNVLNMTNVQSYRYRIDNSGNPYREEVTLWPILPTLGMTIQF